MLSGAVFSPVVACLFGDGFVSRACAAGDEIQEAELQYAARYHVGWQAALLRCLLLCCCCACMVSGCVACLFAVAVLPLNDRATCLLELDSGTYD